MSFGVMAIWDGAAAGASCYPDPRLPQLGLRCIVPPAPQAAAAAFGAELVDAAAYEAHRIALGVPSGGLDFAYGDAFPHEADMDQLHGVDFQKGCYVGQEVVSRMEHRGSARTRVVPVAFGGAAPAAGSAVTAAGRSVGTMGSAAGDRGLALLRLDRVDEALAAGAPLMAGDTQLRLVKPAWARFAFPGDPGAHMSAALLHPDGLRRCPWARQDPLYVAYHDTEWGVPEFDDRALYEKLVLDGFQAGLSWITILRKRDNFRRAFDGFAPEKIARYTPEKIERLMQDAGIVRNRMKIEGAVLSARAYLEVMEKEQGFARLLVGFPRRTAEGERVPQHQADAGRDPAVAADLQGAQAPRLQVLRPYHRVCLHAGGRHGQRSSGDLSPARGPAAAQRSHERPARRAARRRAHGSACCRDAGSTSSTPPRSTSRWRISPMGWRALRAGTARPKAPTSTRSPSIRSWSRPSPGSACA